jgi:hypothetical protein
VSHQACEKFPPRNQNEVLVVPSHSYLSSFARWSFFYDAGFTSM